GFHLAAGHRSDQRRLPRLDRDLHRRSRPPDWDDLASRGARAVGRVLVSWRVATPNPPRFGRPGRPKPPREYGSSIAEVEPQGACGSRSIEGHAREFVPSRDPIEQLGQEVVEGFAFADGRLETFRVEKVRLLERAHGLHERLDTRVVPDPKERVAHRAEIREELV